MKRKSTKLILGIIVTILSTMNTKAQLIYNGVNIDINNVKARINNQCSEFWDPNTQVNTYEIPKGSGKNTLYTGGLWIAGFDASNQLHLSAETYNQNGSNNYWPGPLDLSNGTSADPNVWNKIWKVNKSTILNHIANWNTPGYIIPTEITNWPGNAPTGSNYSAILAPFYDTNNNQIYEPALGDYPYIYGDQAVYFICNDNYAPNTLGSPSLKVEIHGMAWAYSAPTIPFMDNTLFMRYQIVNRSGVQYNNFSFGIWTDADLGNAADDYVGVDVSRNMHYFYNGDSNDDGAVGYGFNTPAQGIKLLNHSLSTSLYYQNFNGMPNGNPVDAIDYYHYLTANWIDSVHVTYGGDGRGTGPGATSLPCNYMFPESTDPSFPAQAWNMGLAGIAPNDMRGVFSSNGSTLPSNGVLTFDLAYITAFNGRPDSSIMLLQAYADSIQARYLNGTVTSVSENIPKTAGSMTIEPNPMKDYAFITFNNVNDESGLLTITSLDGKIVMQKKINAFSKTVLDRKNLSAGVYIVNARFKSQTLNSKLLID